MQSVKFFFIVKVLAIAGLVLLPAQIVAALDDPQDSYIEIAAGIISDGTCGDGSQPDFDQATGTNAGFDSSSNNGIVCFGDRLSSKFSVSLKGADVENLVVYLESNIPFGSFGDDCFSKPDFEEREGTTWANDEFTAYYCDLGPVEEGTKIEIFTSQINNLPNGELVTLDGCIETSNLNTGGFETGECAGPIEVISTELSSEGVPFYAELDKSKSNRFGSYTQPGESEDLDSFQQPKYTSDNGNGEAGKYVYWDLDLFIDKQNTRLQDDGTGGLTLTIEDSWIVTDENLAVVADNIELATTELPDAPSGNSDLEGCSEDTTYATIRSSNQFSANCTQPGGPGTPIQIELTIFDTNKTSEIVEQPSSWNPNQGYQVHNGDPDYYYFDLGYVVFIPMTDIDVDPNRTDSVQIDNTAEIVSSSAGPLPLVSQDGLVNPGPEIDTSSIVVNDQVPGGGSASIQKSFLGTDRSGRQEKTGSRVAYPGEVVHSLIKIDDERNLDTNPVACETIDTSVFRFAGANEFINDKEFGDFRSTLWYRSWNSGIGVIGGFSNSEDVSIDGIRHVPAHSTDQLIDRQVVIEYSDVASSPSHWDATCGDDDNGDGDYDWVSDPRDLPGGDNSVTKVRVTWNRDFSELEDGLEDHVTGAELRHYIALEVRDDVGLLDGDLLANTMTYKLGPDSDSSDERWINPVSDSGVDVQGGIHNVNQDSALPLYSFDYYSADRIEIDSSTSVSDPLQLSPYKSIRYKEFGYINQFEPMVDLIEYEVGVWVNQPTNGVNGNPILSAEKSELHDWTLVDIVPPWFEYAGNNCVEVFPSCVVDDSDPKNIELNISQVSWSELSSVIWEDNEIVVEGYLTADYTDYLSDYGEMSPGNILRVSVDDADIMAQYPAGYAEVVDTPYALFPGYLNVSKKAVEERATLEPDASSVEVAWDVTIQNNGWGYIQGQQFIDIFPYVGDGRSEGNTERYPGTDGEVSLELTNISSVDDTGFSVEYYTGDPLLVMSDPCHYSNWPSGAMAPASGLCSTGFTGENGIADPLLVGSGDTVWLDSEPADLSSVTAVRVNPSDLDIQSSRTYRLDFRVSNVSDSVVLCNNVSYAFGGCPLDTVSNDSCIQVVAGGIGDFVWLDLNSDGVQDSGEAGITGVEVRLLDINGDAVVGEDGLQRVETTDVNGYYFFGHLPVGDYAVEVVTDTLPDLALPTFDADGGFDHRSNAVISDSIFEDRGQDFGYVVPVYDLALIKSFNGSPLVSVGDEVVFVLTVLNQGSQEVMDVQLVDSVPDGLTLIEGRGWSLNDDGQAIIDDPIQSLGVGEDVEVEIYFTVDSTASGNVRNFAEISEFSNRFGETVLDSDSDPDFDPSDTVIDDVVDNTGGDEDDSDIAVITVAASDTSVPIDIVPSIVAHTGSSSVWISGLGFALILLGFLLSKHKSLAA